MISNETAIFEVFESISKIGSLKQKVELLKKAYNIDPKLFQQIVTLVFDKRLKFYVNEKTIQKLKCGKEYQTSFDEFLKVADILSKRRATGNKAIELLQGFWNKLDLFHCKWYSRILLKDLRIGAGENLFEQVVSIKNLQKVPSPMLASSIDDIPEKILNKILEDNTLGIEVKIDGFRLVTCIYDNHIECYSRNGKRITYLEEIFFDDFNMIMQDKKIPKPIILDGEVFSKDWNLTMSFSPARKTRLSPDQEKMLRYYIFDILPGDIKSYKKNDVVKIPYIKRKEKLKQLFKTHRFKQFIYVDHIEAKKDKMQMIQKLTDKFIQDGFEGSVVKLINSYYYWGKRTRDWIKVKRFHTIDLLVVDVEKSTKRPNEIGALVVMYKGNKVRVSGLTDEQKQKWYKNPKEIVGKIIEVKHMGETSGGKLRHPNFVRIRWDKDIPDA